MKTYNVTIRATVTKTYAVGAENPTLSADQAHEIFSVLNDGADESYDQETIEAKEAS